MTRERPRELVWGLPRCVWARESTAPAQGNQSLYKDKVQTSQFNIQSLTPVLYAALLFNLVTLGCSLSLKQESLALPCPCKSLPLTGALTLLFSIWSMSAGRLGAEASQVALVVKNPPTDDLRVLSTLRAAGGWEVSGDSAMLGWQTDRKSVV